MRIEFYPDAANEWRWRAVAGNNKILAVSSEGYRDREDCEAALVQLTLTLRQPGAVVVEIGEDGGKAQGALHALVDRHVDTAR